jgi:hypothetical protein
VNSFIFSFVFCLKEAKSVGLRAVSGSGGMESTNESNYRIVELAN